MKIELELDHIGDHNVRMLRSWASVGRLFDAALQQLANCEDKLGANLICSEDELQDVRDVMEDLERMKQPLDSLHYQLRSLLVAAGVKPLWKQD